MYNGVDEEFINGVHLIASHYIRLSVYILNILFCVFEDVYNFYYVYISYKICIYIFYFIFKKNFMD